MNLDRIAEKLELNKQTPVETADISVETAYTGDLLSDVLAHAEPGALWITIQKHKNILGVAAAKDLSGIVIAGGVTPEQELLDTAARRHIPVFISKENTFALSGKLFTLLQGNDIQG